jgi:hypothetical protein
MTSGAGGYKPHRGLLATAADDAGLLPALDELADGGL